MAGVDLEELWADQNDASPGPDLTRYAKAVNKLRRSNELGGAKSRSGEKQPGAQPI